MRTIGDRVPLRPGSGVITGDALKPHVYASPGGWCVNTDPTSERLLITFGGLGNPDSKPSFDFWRSTDSFPASKLYLRDHHRSWYMTGILGLGDVDEAVIATRELITQLGTPRVVTLGQSMGGFGALVFGALVGAHAAVAIVPQTTVRLSQRVAMRDRRWARELWRAERMELPAAVYRDSLPLIAKATATRCLLHIDGSISGDRAHCKRLAGLPNVTVREWPFGGHLLAPELVNRGELGGLLEEAFA